MNAAIGLFKKTAGPPAKAPTSDLERWAVKLEDLQQQRAVVELAIGEANDTLRDGLLNGTAATSHSDRVASLEAKARGLDAAIVEAGKRLAAAREADQAAQLEAAQAHAARLLADYRRSTIESGRAVNAAYRAFQADYAAYKAYQTCIAGTGLPDLARALGAPADEQLLFVSRTARAIETLLGPEDFAKTGLPKYNQVTWKEQP
jgi:hypothetical protein